jgi:hypothetical protein
MLCLITGLQSICSSMGGFGGVLHARRGMSLLGVALL